MRARIAVTAQRARRNSQTSTARIHQADASTPRLAALSPLFDGLGLPVERRFGSSFWLKRPAR